MKAENERLREERNALKNTVMQLLADKEKMAHDYSELEQEFRVYADQGASRRRTK
jgi:hypothetical protein